MIERKAPTFYILVWGKKLFLGHNYKRYSGVDKKAVYGPGTSPCGDLGVLDIRKASNILILISGKGLVWSARASGARWKWELAAKPRVKFRQIWVFTAKFFKIKVFKQKSDKSVYKMQFLVLQRIIALCFDLNNLNGIKKILVEFQSLKSQFQWR